MAEQSAGAGEREAAEGAPLAGRVAIVTGAGGGIGRAHALALAEAGAKVVVNDLGVTLEGSGGDRERAEAVAGEIRAAGGEAIANADSVADHAAAGRIVEAAERAFGRVDVLVNNASIFRDGPFAAMTPDDFAADLSVHLGGTFNLCKHVLPRMAAQGWGRVVNTTSSAWHAGIGFAAYAAAKGGIVSLTYDLAAEYGHLGVTVNAIAPGARTEHREIQGEQWRARVEAAGLPIAPAPGPEPLSPAHVPPIVVYLASESGGGINGVVFEAVGASIGVYARPSVVERIHKAPGTAPWTQEELAAVLPHTLQRRC